MKITHTIVKEDGLCYGMVMPEKPTSPEEFGEKRHLYPNNWAKYDRDMKAYEIALQRSRDAAIRYDDQDKAIEVVKSIARAPIKHDFVYPLPEPLDCEQIRLFRYKAIGHSLWLGWVESVTEYDLDVKISQETKPETKLVLRISQGAEGSEPDYSEAHSLSESIRAYGIGVEEKKEPETRVNYMEVARPMKCNNCGYDATTFDFDVSYIEGITYTCRKCQTVAYHIGMTITTSGVSEREEPTQEEQKQNYEDIIELSKGFTAEAILKNYTITRRA